MLTVGQIIFRIMIIVGAVEALIMVILLYVIPPMSAFLAVIVDTIILTLTSSPLVYWVVVKPYILANQVLNDRIHILENHDELTQLKNRRALDYDLSHLISSGFVASMYTALLFIDVNNFKKINEDYGRSFGDMVLQKVADRLRESMRREDVGYRLEADKFVVLLTSLDPDPKEAHWKAVNIANRIINQVEASFPFQQQRLKVKVNAGLKFLSPLQKQSTDKILEYADIAMSQAKQSGEKIVIFNT